MVFGGKIGEKTLNIKIGFDLTQGNNGAPSLRIRDFEDHVALKPRAAVNVDSDENENEKKDTSPRADSLSESDVKNSDKSKEGDRSAKSPEEEEDVAAEDSDSDKQRSTRGLKPGDYEPDDRPKVHGKYVAESDSEPASM